MKKYLISILLFLILISCNIEKLKFWDYKKEEIKTSKQFYNLYVKNNLIIDSVYLCAEKLEIEPEILIAIMRFESNFDVKAFNSKNENRSVDSGLMQLNSFTFPGLTIDQLFDIECNIFNGAKHLKVLLDKYNGNEILAVSAYNCGEWRVDNEKIKMNSLNYASNVINYKNYLKLKYAEFKNK